MAYDKPKVTIDLEEYLELKRQRQAENNLGNMDVGLEVAISEEFGNHKRFTILGKKLHEGGSITYDLGERMKLIVLPKK